MQQINQSCAEPTQGLPEEFDRTVIVSGLTTAIVTRVRD